MTNKLIYMNSNHYSLSLLTHFPLYILNIFLDIVLNSSKLINPFLFLSCSLKTYYTSLRGILVPYLKVSMRSYMLISPLPSKSRALNAVFSYF
jgi:hypothetical protein